MNHVLSVTLLAPCLLVPAAYANDKGEVAIAQRVATAWLALPDGAKYAESWDSAASVFKAAITKADWEKTPTSVESR